MKSFIKALSVFLIISFTLVGCVEKKEKSISTGNKEKYLVYDIGEISQDLYSLDSKNIKNNELLNILFSGLVYEDYNTMQIKPGLADKWTISQDGMEYTFHIRNGLKWSNSDNMTAYDIYDFFKKILSCENKKLYGYDLNCIYGVDDYIKGKVSFDKVAINVINDNTIRIRLNSPCSYFLKKLAQPIYNVRKMDVNLKNWTKYYSTINYSGPYTISKISDNTVLFKKNNNYFLKDNINLNKFNMKYHHDEKNVSAYAVTDFENSKDVDIFLNPPLSEISKLKDKGEAKVFKTWNTLAIYFNLNKSSICSNINFRKAVTCLLDRNKIVNSVPDNIITSENTFVPYELFRAGDCENLFKNLDLKSGVENFDKSGYCERQNIKVVYKENNLNRQICEEMIHSINEELKSQNKCEINFDIEGYDEKDLNEIIKQEKYDIYFGEYNIWYNSAVSFFEMLDSNSPENLNYKNLSYDDYVYYLHNLNGDNDNTLKSMEKQLINDLPVVPIALKNNVVCRKEKFKNLKENKYGELMVNTF